VGLITLEVKDRPDDERSAEERCNLPIGNKDSFEDSEIPDEGDRAINPIDVNS
jgi:hypothetical protein